MSTPAIGYTTGDERKVETAGDELSGPLAWTGAADSHAIEAKVTADTHDRFTVEVDGSMAWGPGNGAADTNLYRSAADHLKTDDTLHVGASNTIKLGAAGDTTIQRTGVDEITVTDLVVTGTFTATIDSEIPADLEVDTVTTTGAVVVGTSVTAADLTCTDDLSVGDDATITGSLTAADITATTTVTAADLAATDDLTVGDAASVGGDLTVTGSATAANLTATATVQGADLVATDDLTVGDDATITGSLSAADATISGAANVGSLASSGAVSGTSITGSGTVQGATVASTGAVTAATNVVATGNVSGVDLTASGDVSVGDDLTVTDDASVGGDLTVTGAAAVGTLTVGGVTVQATPMPAAGHYVATAGQSATTTTATPGNQTMRAFPFLITETRTATKLAAEVTSAGESGSKIRLGIYSDNGDCYPGALLVDGGQINGNSATVQEVTISQVLTPGLYWFVSCVQSAASSQPTVRAPSTSHSCPIPLGMGTSLPGSNTQIFGYQETGIGNAGLPANFTSTVTTSSSGARVLVKLT